MADLDRTQHADTVRPVEGASDLVYWAWTIIANVSEGDWFKQTDEWREAAIRWRGAFHASLKADQSDGSGGAS